MTPELRQERERVYGICPQKGKCGDEHCAAWWAEKVRQDIRRANKAHLSGQKYDSGTSHEEVK